MHGAVRLPRSFYGRRPTEVAPELLNKVLITPLGAARIVETEAYGGADDPGSHGFRRPTPRNEAMFGPPGHLYVYFTYGMHWCANAVVDAAGTAGAVLLRAAIPLSGIEAMFSNRPKARRLEDLCSGPAKLCQALGIDGSANGTDLTAVDQPLTILDDQTAPPRRADQGPRIGLAEGRGSERLWRWAVPGSAHVSRRFP